jgi:hypothetical protein
MSGRDLWVLLRDGNRNPVSVLKTDFDVGASQWSPDGRLLAYTSRESGACYGLPPRRVVQSPPLLSVTHARQSSRAYEIVALLGAGGRGEVSRDGQRFFFPLIESRADGDGDPQVVVVMNWSRQGDQ